MGSAGEGGRRFHVSELGRHGFQDLGCEGIPYQLFCVSGGGLDRQRGEPSAFSEGRPGLEKPGRSFHVTTSRRCVHQPDEK